MRTSIRTGHIQRRVATACCVIALLLGHDAAAAQVRFDVKTPLAEKKALAVAKSGVISYLKRAPWAHVVETGETYALFLRQYRRSATLTATTVSLTLEVRRPRAIGEGPLVATRRLSVSYDHNMTGVALTNQERQTAIDLESDRAFQALALVLTSVVGGAMFDPGAGRTIVKNSVLFAGQDLQRTPTFDETLECLAVGARVLGALEQMRARGTI